MFKTLFALLGGLILIVVAVAFVPLVSLTSSVIYALPLQALWGWFIVPLFHLPALSFGYAVGLLLVAGLFLAGITRVTVGDFFQTVIGNVFVAICLYAMGFIVHFFM